MVPSHPFNEIGDGPPLLFPPFGRGLRRMFFLFFFGVSFNGRAPKLFSSFFPRDRVLEF